MITVVANGRPVELPEGSTLTGYSTTLGIPKAVAAMEHNGVPVTRSDQETPPALRRRPNRTRPSRRRRMTADNLTVHSLRRSSATDVRAHERRFLGRPGDQRRAALRAGPPLPLDSPPQISPTS